MNENGRKLNIYLGIGLGFFLCLITFYIYFIDIYNLTNVWYGTISALLIIIIGLASVIIKKKESKGLITFKDAFSTYFKTILIGSFISTTFLIIIFQLFLTPEKIILIKNLLIDFNNSLMKINNTSEIDIKKSIEFSKNFDPSNIFEIIKSAVRYLLRDCIFGFIISFIMRNKTSI